MDLIRQVYGEDLDRTELNKLNSSLYSLISGRQKHIGGRLVYLLAKRFDLNLDWWYEDSGPMFAAAKEIVPIREDPLAAALQRRMNENPKVRLLVENILAIDDPSPRADKVIDKHQQKKKKKGS